MSIPNLVDGRLPPGLHRAIEEEIRSRFCADTPRRRALARPLGELVDLAREAHAIGLYLNGSFVTDKPSPNDVDAVIVLPLTFDKRGPLADRLRAIHRTYGFDIERVAADDSEELDYLLNEFFGTDRSGNARGLLEVIL